MAAPILRVSLSPLLLICVLTGLGSLILPGSAHAYLELCNKTEIDLYVAYAYHENGQWVARGWRTIDTETCEEVISDELDNRYFYFYAESTEDEDVNWSGGTSFCTEDGKFVKRSHKVCNGRWKRTGFKTIDVGRDAKKFVYNIKWPPTNQGDEDEED